MGQSGSSVQRKSEKDGGGELILGRLEVVDAATMSGRGDRVEIMVSMVDQGTQQKHRSLSNRMHSSLGAAAERIVTTLCRFNISPFHRRYRAWEAFLAVLIVYTAWVMPFEFGFLDGPTTALSIADYIVCGALAIDIVLNFFIAYIDKTTDHLTDNPKQIACKYMTTWFAFDILSTIPLELARKILPPFLQSYGLFSLPRLWCLRRVNPLFARLENDTQYNFIWVQCAKLICLTLFWVHYAGCFYYLLAANYHDPKNTWIGASNDKFHKISPLNRYLKSIYWSITTFTTLDNGYLPKNTREEIFNVFYTLSNFGLIIYLVGNTSEFVARQTRRTIKIKEDMQKDSSFIKRLKLSPNLQLRLKLGTISKERQFQRMFISQTKDIQLELARCLLENVYLFRGVSNKVLHKLVCKIKVQNFPLNGNVILQDNVPTDVYILVDGVVDTLVFNNGIEEVVGEAKKGDIFGEIGTLNNMLHPFTFRTKKESLLLQLKCTTFLKIIRYDTEVYSIIMNNFQQHMEELERTGFPARGLDLKDSNYCGHTTLEHILTAEAFSNPISVFHLEADGQTSRDSVIRYDDGDDPPLLV